MRKILVVDDDAFERKILSGLLNNKYDVIVADSAQNMFSILSGSSREISAVLLDIVMPDIDGFEALERIHDNALWRQLPVIVTTSLSDEDSKVKALSLGANGYITKPFNRELLIYTIENTIELQEKSALANTFRKDKLTDLYNREGFLEMADEMIHEKEPGYYILSCFDIENFKMINDQYGIYMGDEVLKHIANCVGEFVSQIDGICCRFMADKFGALYPAK